MPNNQLIPNNWEVKIINVDDTGQSITIEPGKPVVLLMNIKKNIVIPEQPVQTSNQ